MAIRSGETWWVALRYGRRRVTVVERWHLPRWWRCRDLSSGDELVVREDWFTEFDSPKRRRRRRDDLS